MFYYIPFVVKSVKQLDKNYKILLLAQDIDVCYLQCLVFYGFIWNEFTIKIIIFIKQKTPFIQKHVLCKKKFSKITSITFITKSSCPSSVTSFVTLTSHVITYSVVSTLSYALLRAIHSIPPFSTF